MQIAMIMSGNKKNCAMSSEVGFFTSSSSSGVGTDTLVLLPSIVEQRRIGQNPQGAQEDKGEFQGRTPEFAHFRIRGCVPEIPLEFCPSLSRRRGPASPGRFR